MQGIFQSKPTKESNKIYYSKQQRTGLLNFFNAFSVTHLDAWIEIVFQIKISLVHTVWNKINWISPAATSVQRRSSLVILIWLGHLIVSGVVHVTGLRLIALLSSKIENPSRLALLAAQYIYLDSETFVTLLLCYIRFLPKGQ